ncbi:DUF3267 domain-containing protein [Spirosoma sp. KCTC 42546]|uniref:DUF3267 domain-containing protein n=1 Tax=Spirosoma sp. KCTC 42546 TaxID=2520506 RepID=UPI00115BEDA3|nr:DUF3267 domain-containing protein [Spirosoma sp. KCTC 42546]QDK82399.1 DUF3267 domain-containing protein [Spirosoma sp. KCTC 42546]
MSTLKAQLYGGIAFFIGAPLLVWPFSQLWNFSLKQIAASGLAPILLFIAAMFVGIVVHELIHGLTAMWVGRLPWQKIKFGVQWQSGTPYCHPTVPMPARAYRIVVIMPLVTLGLVPYGAALATGNVWLLAFGVFFTLAAFGDIIILWLMRHLRATELVQDHPTKVGLIIVSPDSTP